MSQRTLTAGERDILEKYLNSIKHLINAKISLCTAHSVNLGMMREYPGSLIIFRAEGIRNINQAQRKIPKIIKSLQELSGQICLENYEFFLTGEAYKKYEELGVVIDEIGDLVESKFHEVPMPRPSLSFWFLSPHKAVVYYVNLFIIGIKKRRLEKEKKALAAKKLD